MFGMKRFGSMFPRQMMAAPDAGGAGGGAGDGGDAGADDKPMSRKEIEDLVGKSIGTHINSRGFQEKLRKGLATSDDIVSLRKLLEERASAGAGGAGDGGDAGGAQGGGASPQGDQSRGAQQPQSKADPETQRLLREQQHTIEDMQKQMQGMRREKEETEKRQRETEERTALKDALTGKVRATLLPAAVALLYGERKAIGRNKEGGLIFKTKDRDGYDVDVPIEDGIKGWLETAEGKEYLPPVDASGSGDGKSPRGDRRGAHGLESTDKNVRGAAATSVLFGT